MGPWDHRTAVRPKLAGGGVVHLFSPPQKGLLWDVCAGCRTSEQILQEMEVNNKHLSECSPPPARPDSDPTHKRITFGMWTQTRTCLCQTGASYKSTFATAAFGSMSKIDPQFVSRCVVDVSVLRWIHQTLTSPASDQTHSGCKF